VDAGAGLLGAWARRNRYLSVEVGDHVLSVNSVRGNSANLWAECQLEKPLRLLVKKQGAFDHAEDSQSWLQGLKNSVRWPFQSQQRAIAPCQEVCEDELLKVMERFDEDRDGKLSPSEFQKLARSDFWLMSKLPPADPPPAPPCWAAGGNEASSDEEPCYKEPKPKPQTGDQLKCGIYQRADGLAMGSLHLRYAEADKAYAKSFVFMVTSCRGDGQVEHWSATLEPGGLDVQKREMWRLSGHPSPSVFIQTEVDGTHQLIECDFCKVPLAACASLDAGSGAMVVSGGVRRVERARERQVWKFQKELQGMFFSEPVGLPLEQRSKNFVQAVITKDPSEDAEGAPDTQSIVKRFARYNKTLPDGPISRQLELVKLYTVESPLYHEMNRALREDDLAKMKLFGAYIKELRDVFLTDHEYQIIKPFTGTVWRGISRVADLEATKRQYVPGKDFLWTGFTSTTTDKGVAMRWGQIVFQIEVEPPEGMYDDEVWEFAPAEIKEFSAYASENEVLFPPNVKFRVTEVTEEQGKALVHCVATALDGIGGAVEFGNSAPVLMEQEGTMPAPTLVKQLRELGFAEERVERALTITRNDLEAAKAWLKEKTPADDAAAVTPRMQVIQRVQNRPKIGEFVCDNGDEGRLCVQKGRCGKRRAYIFTVTESAGGDFWVARLVHRGHDPLGRDVWLLDGHPSGGTFVNDKGNFLECDQDDGTKQRHVWTYRPAQSGEETASASVQAIKPHSFYSRVARKMDRATTFTWDNRSQSP